MPSDTGSERGALRAVTALAALLIATPAPALAQSWDESTDGGGDAGSVWEEVFCCEANRAQVVEGVITEITGATNENVFDFVDVYRIHINDPAGFRASTEPSDGLGGEAEFDTRLYLFAIDEDPLLYNDDSPNDFNDSYQSLLTDPGIFPGQVGPNADPIPGPGDYLLAITGFQARPVDNFFLPVFEPGPFQALLGPDPFGGDVLTWFAQLSPAAGEYTISVRGVGPGGGGGCNGDINDSGGVDFQDLLALLFAWGPCGGCPEDLDGDGTVGFSDLLILLNGWGPCS